MRKFQIGDQVVWVSSNTKKIGEVTAIVPAGKLPREVGKPKAGGGGMHRDHESYVVRGKKLNSKNAPYGHFADYWPFVSLLNPTIPRPQPVSDLINSKMGV